MNTIELKSRPEICPECGGRIVPIVYGDPSHEMFMKSMDGEIILGGCLVMVDNEGNVVSPQWGCVKCGREYLVKEK